MNPIASLFGESPFKPLQIHMQAVSDCAAVDSCDLAHGIICELDESVETGFRGQEVTHVEEMVERLNAIEDETDQMGMTLTRVLFAQEDHMKPVSVST
jgi:hypothetical protein